ncbi:glycosyl transferase family 1 [Chromobacterium amazonense]|uniref:Glycosyl transferase family 1 n=1 Tax=Chromobacterium amazonense TaxID=1382803 RepID=A0A2S9X8W8_9NEIS|nr:glycosyltransferase family 4 protein [Chromobacterium amazonense]PRP72168.1 glycosyl transferase family 1 [Chromobacterium amazonense]
MTRLAIVRQKYNPAGGAERFVSRALGALRDSGMVQVSLIARGWEAVDGIEVHPVQSTYLGNVWRDWSFARHARRIWQRERFDLVQSHERIPGCDIYRAGDGVHRHWLHLRRQGMSIWQRLALWCNPYHHYIMRAEAAMFTHPRLKLVICNSEMIKREIQHYFDLPASKVTVIYNGVDLKTYHPDLKTQYRQTMRERWSIPEDAPLLVYVGSGFERKGVARTVRAIRDNPQAWLMVVGGDKRLSRYQATAKELGVSDRVVFAGPQQDVKPFYGMADAFILPTLYDPFPNVCVEALACGLPVLTTLQCGAAEFIQPGVNGWVCDALDHRALSDIVGAWLSAREREPDLSAAARESVSRLSLEAMADQMLNCYRQLLSISAKAAR